MATTRELKALTKMLEQVETLNAWLDDTAYPRRSREALDEAIAFEGVEPEPPAVTYIAGADPGLTGAIVLLPASGKGDPVKLAMPVIEVKKKPKGVKRYLDLNIIRQFLVEHNVVHVFIEIQQPHNKPDPQRCSTCGNVMAFASPQGLTSTFTTGRNFGLLEGICVGLGLKYELVHPLTWQKILPAGRGDTKGRALLAAKALFPNLDLRANERCRVAHEGVVDGLLIAEFGRRRLGGSVVYDSDLGF